LKVIEADGEQNMVSGGNDGEESDVFSEGGTFGSEGITIRNRDGILVDWRADVSVENGTYSVEFSSAECGHITDINLPDFGSVLTPDDNIPITGECEGIQYDLTSSDGRGISVENGEIRFSSSGLIGVVGLITGTISCSQGTDFNIEHEFEILGNIPVESTFSSNIAVVESSVVEVPIEFEGDASQMWLVGIDGPLSRVAETQVNQELSDGSKIVLEINPSGLLVKGMVVRGEIILASDSGHNYHIDIELVADDEEESTIEEWTSPAKLIPIALALSALWVVLGISSPSREVATNDEEIPTTPLYGDDPTFVDSFGESY
jgi:hypothetical protein